MAKRKRTRGQTLIYKTAKDWATWIQAKTWSELRYSIRVWSFCSAGICHLSGVGVAQSVVLCLVGLLVFLFSHCICFLTVSSGYLFGIFWLPLWYLLVTSLVSSGYLFGIFWLPLWYLLITPLVSSGYLFGIFWLPLWYLLVTSLVSSGYLFGIFWLPLWYLLVTSIPKW
jgi:hypothetical protein